MSTTTTTTADELRNQLSTVTGPPRVLDVTGLGELPDDLAAAVAERDQAWSEFWDREDECQGARLNLDRAGDDDAAAIRTAATAGKALPKPPDHAARERELRYALEQCKQAKQAVGRANQRVRELFNQHRPRLVSQAVAKARQGVEDYQAEVAQAQTILDAAEVRLAAAYQGVGDLEPLVKDRVAYASPVPPEVRLDPHRNVGQHVAAVRGRLATLEKLAGETSATTERHDDTDHDTEEGSEG